MPCRHLPAVFIPDQTVRLRFVKLVHDRPHARLRLPRLAHVIVKIGHVMTRLVPMRVLPDQARDVYLFATSRLALCCEQLIELARKLRAPTHQRDEPANVLWCEERLLPSVRFSECKRNLARIERLNPASITARAHKAGGVIEDILVRLSPQVVALVIGGPAKLLRYLRD